jgi:hypothetical protein
MHKSATKCNETICKWCKNKHGASKIIDTFETYHSAHGPTITAVPSHSYLCHHTNRAAMDKPGHGKPGPTSPARPGPKISGLGRIFLPDGRVWAAEMRPDCLLRPGLGSRFRGFWEGPARKPDGPTENSSLGPGLGRLFRPDSRAGPGLGSHFFWALSWPGPAREDAQV